MSQRDKTPHHNSNIPTIPDLPAPPDDLSEMKSLIDGAPGGSFELDDILAEYRPASHSGRGAVPISTPRGADKGNVVAFPGTYRPTAEPDDVDEYAAQSTRPDDPEPDDDLFPIDRPRNGTSGDVVPFPSDQEDPDNMLSSLLKDLNRRADDYAEQMYAEDERIESAEARRLERLIPGTDEEIHTAPPKQKKVRLKAPPPPDTPPQELARAFAKGLKSMRIRMNLLFFLCILALVQLIVPAMGFAFVPPLDQPAVQGWLSVGLLGVGILFGYDVVFGGPVEFFRGKSGMELLCALSCLFTLADSVILALTESGRVPYTAAALVGLYMTMLGRYHKKCALRLSCRTAATSSEPYRVTLDERKWNGRDTYSKWSGDATGFGSQIQCEDGAQRIYRCVTPVLLLAGSIYTLFIAATRSDAALWCASAVFTASAAFGSSIVYGRSFHLAARRLASSGVALAGWPGIAGSRRADRILITDTDLFPVGSVEFNGIKVLGNFPRERVVAYTATMIRDSGSGLTRLFHDYLRTMGGLMRNSERLCCYEGGGLSATIRGDQVFVGSAAFMNLMEIPLPSGLNVRNAVFCAINGELAGIFALNYNLPDAVFPALDAIMQEKVGPVLATRDFNLIPSTLQRRFKLSADRMDFPPVERRRELSDPNQPHSDTLTAILCREGLYPFSEAVVCAKRLSRATRLGAVLCCVSSVLGLLLTGYLVYVSAYGSLSPLNLLLYLLLWLLPVWLLSAWTHRF